MNRLQHFLRAKTQYNLHSPLVFRLYTEVLFSRSAEAPRGRGFDAVLWRLEHHYGATAQCCDEGGAMAELATADGRFLLVDRPHRREALWRQLCDDPRYEVTLDLFDCGLAVANPRLSRQHFLLR
ncbi:MAG: hypothetical protein J6I49_08490 [Bacteroidales bacterium]|nr:hypothetical protein [Bacteroidales bacterium]